MSRTNGLDLFAGALVVLTAIAFLTFMRWQTGTGSLSVYPISVELRRADQLNVGTDVRIAGVTVGRITGLSLEPGSYRVKADLYVRADIAIPVDSTINVTGSVMGNPYISIEPGHSTQKVPSGGTLRVP